MSSLTPKDSVEYAWKWFEFHAKQRTTMFNYFIIFSVLFINAIISLITKGLATSSPEILFALLIIGILITFVFCGIDRRNKQLLSSGEDVLINLEKLYIFNEFINEGSKIKSDSTKLQLIDRKGKPLSHFGLLYRECKENERPNLINRMTTHSFLIPVIQYTLILTYFTILWYYFWP